MPLRDGVAGLGGAFFDEFLADGVGDVGSCDGRSTFMDFGGEFDGGGHGFCGFGAGVGCGFGGGSCWGHHAVRLGSGLCGGERPALREKPEAGGLLSAG